MALPDILKAGDEIIASSGLFVGEAQQRAYPLDFRAERGDYVYQAEVLRRLPICKMPHSTHIG